MNNYESAKELQKLALESANHALSASRTDPISSISSLAGTLVHLMEAQIHATLAIVDEMRRDI